MSTWWSWRHGDMVTVMVIIEISDDSDEITRPVCDRRVLMWFSHTFSVASNFLMAMSRVQNVPARLIRLGPDRQVCFFGKIITFIATCPANAGTTVDDHRGSQGVTQPWGGHHSYHLSLTGILESDGDCGDVPVSP